MAFHVGPTWTSWRGRSSARRRPLSPSCSHLSPSRPRRRRRPDPRRSAATAALRARARGHGARARPAGLPPPPSPAGRVPWRRRSELEPGAMALARAPRSSLPLPHPRCMAARRKVHGRRTKERERRGGFRRAPSAPELGAPPPSRPAGHPAAPAGPPHLRRVQQATLPCRPAPPSSPPHRAGRTRRGGRRQAGATAGPPARRRRGAPSPVSAMAAAEEVGALDPAGSRPCRRPRRTSLPCAGPRAAAGL